MQLQLQTRQNSQSSHSYKEVYYNIVLNTLVTATLLLFDHVDAILETVQKRQTLQDSFYG